MRVLGGGMDGVREAQPARAAAPTYRSTARRPRLVQQLISTSIAHVAEAVTADARALAFDGMVICAVEER